MLSLYTSLSAASDIFDASELQFRSVFAQRAGDKTIYCLLGNGYFQAPKTDDADQFITEWISNHPKAQVILVDTFSSGGIIGTTDYIWIKDGNESLNVSLVRQGVVFANVMDDPVDVMKAVPSEMLDPSFGQKTPRRLIADSQYQDFLRDVLEAQAHAEREKKGLWSDRYKGLLNSLGDEPPP